MSMSFLHQADRLMASWIESIPRAARRPFIFLATATHPVAWVMVLGAAIAINLGTNNLEWLPPLIATLLLLPLEQVMKRIFHRARPETMYVDNMRFRSYSFPSGHAYSAALVVGLFAAMSIILLKTPINYFIGAILILLIATIGVSRVYLGAHFPSDVIAGWAIGTAMLMCIIYATNIL